MSDRLDEFERALRAELDIEPSPGFEAGLRRRLAQARPARRGWRFLAPALAALTAVAVLAGLAARGTPPPPPASSHAAAVARPAPLAPGPEVPLAPPRAPSPVRAATGARGPRVIVPPGQREALLRFVARLDAESLPAPPALASPAALADDLPAPAPIAIAPLDVAPLTETPLPLERSDS
jgi:hypothetical protein